MFFLGGFSSYLPYLILAIVSFAGVAGFSPKVLNLKLQKAEKQDNTVEIKQIKESNLEQDTYNYSDYYNADKYTSGNITNNKIIFIKYHKEHQFTREKADIAIQQQYCSGLFFRPPPSV